RQHSLHLFGAARLHRGLRRIFAAAALVPRVRVDGGGDQAQIAQVARKAHPNTSTALPVIAKGASVQRNLTTRATSWGCITGENVVLRSMAVSVEPGSTAAQKMPRSRPSSASDLIKPVRPHLLAL